MLAADVKSVTVFLLTQKLRLFLRQLKQALSVALPLRSRATDNTVVTGNQPTEETDNKVFDWTILPR